jgi:hypothetical protein
MTYQNDPNSPNVRRVSVEEKQTSYLGWMVGAALIVAIIVGVFVFNRSATTNTASNPAASGTVTSSSPNASTPPSRETTGGGTATNRAPSTPANQAR